MALDRRAETQKRIKEALSAADQLTTLQGGGSSPGFASSPMGAGIGEAAFNSALQRMMQHAPGPISVTSGKRSTQRQAELWEQALKKYGSPDIARKWVAPPGRSKHETGIAADLKYASDEVKNWAHQNAQRFGLHFPLSNEPWHIEIAGSR